MSPGVKTLGLFAFHAMPVGGACEAYCLCEDFAGWPFILHINAPMVG